ATEHQAACHFAEEALQSDVGVVAHSSGDAGMRRGTPDSATAGLEAERAAGGVASATATAEPPATEAPAPSGSNGEPEG
ncbi:MAG: hypothetical protein ABI864_04495, partial [Chloroflexota bacterium]